MSAKYWVEVCIACGKISTPFGVKTTSKGCQLSRKVKCIWQRQDMTIDEINAYCTKRGWKPLVTT